MSTVNTSQTSAQPQSRRFKDQTVVVTGASSGIGRNTALAFAKEGANVVVAARRDDRLKSLVDEIKELGSKAIAVKADISIEADNKTLIEEAVKAFGSINAVFLNAGVFSSDNKPIWEADSKTWQKNYHVNVFGVQLGLKYALKQLVAQNKGGSVVINSSAVGLVSQENLQNNSGYTSSKFAVTGIVKYVAAEAANHNIRINAVAPGVIETDMTGGAEGAQQFAKAVHIIKRPGKVKDVASAVLFLADPQNDFITGISLPVDGGFTSK
mmetsp:Transcript_12968/g.20793  ORF Transcript_12968/g.20793 Transcript_12968/m.20793 type:complete len:268 (-) Transcript_12968:57-860(-)|eukprot:jgi/Bigna1/53603/estExt_Genewise1Plus.C_210144